MGELTVSFNGSGLSENELAEAVNRDHAVCREVAPPIKATLESLPKPGEYVLGYSGYAFFIVDWNEKPMALAYGGETHWADDGGSPRSIIEWWPLPSAGTGSRAA